MADELNSGIQLRQAITLPAPSGTVRGNFAYIPKRGLFELHSNIGRGRYVWQDGSFNDDDLTFIKSSVLPVNNRNLIGSVYKANTADFFLFFSSDPFWRTDDGLDVFALFFSTDNSAFFPWPTSFGALRFPIPPIAIGDGFVPSARPDSMDRGDVGLKVGIDSFFERHGLAWKLSLSHQDVENISRSTSTLSTLVPDPEIRAALAACVAIIRGVDQLGGNRGVDVSGVLPTSYTFITPRGSFDIIQVAKIVGNIAQKVGDQTSQAVRDGLNGIADGFKSAGDAAGKIGEQAGRIGGLFG